MTKRSERRSFSRVSSDVAVSWIAETVDKPTRGYLKRVASNISLGGMFLETSHPPAVGTVVRLAISVHPSPSQAGPVYAKAIVRWRSKWSSPPGMGLQFLDFEGLGNRDLQEWLQSVLRTDEAKSER